MKLSVLPDFCCYMNDIEVLPDSACFGLHLGGKVTPGPISMKDPRVIAAQGCATPSSSET